MWAPKYDVARFGAEFPRFSPRQTDLLIDRRHDHREAGPGAARASTSRCASPSGSIAFGVCASTGGFYQNYSTMPGADQVIPVDVYIPGCPPRPEQVLDGLIMLQDKIQEKRGYVQKRERREHDALAAGQGQAQGDARKSSKRSTAPRRLLGAAVIVDALAIAATRPLVVEPDAHRSTCMQHAARRSRRCSMNFLVDLTAVDYRGARAALRGRLPPALVHDRRAPARQGAARRARRRIATRSIDTVVAAVGRRRTGSSARSWDLYGIKFARPSRSAPHPHVRGVRRPSAAQGLPQREAPAARAPSDPDEV